MTATAGVELPRDLAGRWVGSLIIDSLGWIGSVRVSERVVGNRVRYYRLYKVLVGFPNIRITIRSL